MVRLSPPLSCRTSPVPASPDTVPPTLKVFVAQLTDTVVTSEPPTVPEAPDRVQVWLGLEGCVLMLTAKAAPLATLVANEKAPFAEMVRSSPPLSRSTSPVPDNPETVPPTLYVLVVQATVTLLMLAPAMVPLPLPTTQVWLGPVGWVLTVTA